MEETDDESFFRPKEALEDEIKKNPKIQIRNYLGNLRNEKGFKGIQWLKIKFCVQIGHIKIFICLFCKIESDFQNIAF